MIPPDLTSPPLTAADMSTAILAATIISRDLVGCDQIAVAGNGVGCADGAVNISGRRRGGRLCETLQAENAPFEHCRV
jgi:hypothetical protein